MSVCVLKRLEHFTVTVNSKTLWNLRFSGNKAFMYLTRCAYISVGLWAWSYLDNYRVVALWFFRNWLWFLRKVMTWHLSGINQWWGQFTFPLLVSLCDAVTFWRNKNLKLLFKSFRNYSNIISLCSRIIYYYQCWKQCCLFLFKVHGV